MEEIYVKGRTVRLLCRLKTKILLVESHNRVGYWEFPGGNVKSYEIPEVTGFRELHEKVSLAPAKLRFIDSIRLVAPEDMNICWEHFLYKALSCDYAKLQIEPNEIRQSRWLTKKEALLLQLEAVTAVFLNNTS